MGGFFVVFNKNNGLFETKKCFNYLNCKYFNYIFAEKTKILIYVF